MQRTKQRLLSIEERLDKHLIIMAEIKLNSELSFTSMSQNIESLNSKVAMSILASVILHTISLTIGTVLYYYL